ncbi:hypothetical protein OAV04_01690 [Candidatus Poseidoniaceae archaeon]|nr:hypothetical protein [Candidatus Poseidoniaceae archaeon]
MDEWTIMQMIRAINVITLACLLLLTGCFGLVDDEVSPEAEGQTTTTSNHPPTIDVWQDIQFGVEETRQFDPVTNISSVIGANVSLYHAAVDVDGDALTIGWDVDLNGITDSTPSANSGFTTLFVPLAHWHAAPNWVNPSIDTQVASIAFIATDSAGNAVSEFVHINSPPFSTSYLWSTYQFGAEDANGDTTAGTEDNMVRVTMSQGGDLNWASISVKISVNNGAPVTCDNPGATGGSCGLVEFGSTSDQVWSVGDGVTIVESGQDLCTAGETCEVKVTITDTREGRTLDESTSFAE